MRKNSSASLLYLFRHGTACPPGLMLGRLEIAPASEGERQAFYWRAKLAGVTFSAAWCSPLTRARHTAGLILNGNPANTREMVSLPDLAEIDLGDWQGRSKNWVREHYPELWAARGRNPALAAPPGGESYADLAARVWPAFAGLLPEAGRHAASLLVAHRSVNQVILARLKGLPLSAAYGLPQPPAALTILRLSPAGTVTVEETQIPPK